MGFWDRDVNNSFDRMFDYNRDGILSPAEQGLQFEFFDNLTKVDSTYDENLDIEEEIEAFGDIYDSDDFDE